MSKDSIRPHLYQLPPKLIAYAVIGGIATLGAHQVVDKIEEKLDKPMISEDTWKKLGENIMREPESEN